MNMGRRVRPVASLTRRRKLDEAFEGPVLLQKVMIQPLLSTAPVIRRNTPAAAARPSAGALARP